MDQPNPEWYEILAGVLVWVLGVWLHGKFQDVRKKRRF